MTDKPWWAELFDGEEGRVYARHFGGDVRPLGQRPAVLVIDVVRSFTGERGQTLEESAAEWQTSCGPNAWTAMPYLRQIVRLAGQQHWPLIYTTGQPGSAALYGGTVKRERDSMKRPDAQDIPDEIKPPADALVLAKPKASAFFQTPLLTYLIRRGVDSLIVTGTTTCGCVRATVVDGHSHGYPVFVVEDAVFDRARLSHGVSLFEMNAKYADVITTERLTGMAEAAGQVAEGLRGTIPSQAPAS